MDELRHSLRHFLHRTWACPTSSGCRYRFEIFATDSL